MNWLEGLPWWEWRPWLTWLTALHCLMTIAAGLLTAIVSAYIDRKRHDEPLPAFWRARFWNRKDCEQRRRKPNWLIFTLVLFITMGMANISFWVMTFKFDWADGYIIKRPWSEVYRDREIKKESAESLESH